MFNLNGAENISGLDCINGHICLELLDVQNSQYEDRNVLNKHMYVGCPFVS